MASLFQNAISGNTKRAVRDSFRRDSHKCCTLLLWTNVIQANMKGFLLRVTYTIRRVHTMTHWKRINSHCLHSHWVRINRKSHWMRVESIHFHRWFETGLKMNCIITWNNADVIFSRVIGYVNKPAIRQEITSITLLLCLGKLLYLLCYVYGFTKALYGVPTALLIFM